jgi:hypothetical protein
MSYNLPPRDLLFKLIDRDTKLIVRNYFNSRNEIWETIYQNSLNAQKPGLTKETGQNSHREKSRQPSDSHNRSRANSKTNLKRNLSLGLRRRISSSSRKSNFSSYKV